MKVRETIGNDGEGEGDNRSMGEENDDDEGLETEW